MTAYCKCGSELNDDGSCIQQMKQHEFIFTTVTKALEVQKEPSCCNGFGLSLGTDDPPVIGPFDSVAFPLIRKPYPNLTDLGK